MDGSGSRSHVDPMGGSGSREPMSGVHVREEVSNRTASIVLASVEALRSSQDVLDMLNIRNDGSAIAKACSGTVLTSLVNYLSVCVVAPCIVASGMLYDVSSNATYIHLFNGT